jgi:outer membrane protein OmpA-like peptidoglycan-associated protein
MTAVLGAAWSSAAAQTASATAPTAHGFALNRFEPSERGSEWFVHDTLDIRGGLRPAIGLVLDYGYKPYVLVNPDGSENTSIIADQLFLHIGGSMVFLSRMRVGVNFPILMTQDGSETGSVVHGQRVVGATRGGIGDLRFGADLRLVGAYGDPFTLAVGGRMWLPTGDSTKYVGDNEVRVGPQLLAAGDIDAFVYAVSLGVVYRANSSGFVGHPTGSEATFGAAIGVRAIETKLVIGPEIWGSTVLAGGDAVFGARTTPLAVIVGAHYAARDFRFGLGAGPGLSRAAGTSIFRALASIEYVPAYTEVAKPTDRDGDRIFDTEDACPDTPGVRTEDPKTNGCPLPPPPLDRDGDGILDGEDACPDVTGVRTDDPRTNGCPSDRDKDGVLDTADACPDVAGVHTEDPRTNGCPPDPDRDKDGILNDADACPDTPGPKSDDPRTTGCPRVFIRNAQIQILEQPKFDFNRAAIKKESYSLLAEVAKVMNDHLEIKRVTVEGHTDSVGSSQFNKALSQQRAEAVVKWLTDHGVAKERLSAQGMGKEQPIMPNDTDAGRAANRRVEFHIEVQDTTTRELVKPPTGEAVAAPPATKAIPEGAAPTPKKDIPSPTP